MKSLFVFFAAIAFAASSFAQNRIIIFPPKDSVLKVDDRFWHERVLTTSLTTKNGTIFMPGGTVKTNDGKITQLKNGDYVDEGGNVATLYIDPMPASGFAMNDGKFLVLTLMKSNSDECFRKSDGKFWVDKYMTHPLTIKNGASVMLDGTIKDANGKTFKLQDHDGIDENGNEIKMDVTTTKPMDCMYRHNGIMMYMTELKKDTTLKTGLIIRTDGTIKAPNGHVTDISDGGLVSIDGATIITRGEDK